MSILETKQDIQDTLIVLGEPLQFASFFIYGLLDFTFSDMFSGSIEQQIWEIKVATDDTITHLIAIDDEFTIITNEQVFSFQLTRPPIPYGDGWSRLAVDLISTTTI